MLSNSELRKRYDKYGKEKAVPDSGFGMSRPSVRVAVADDSIEDPAEFFSMIFGGEAFIDLYALVSEIPTANVVF